MSNCTRDLIDGVILEAYAPVWHRVGAGSMVILDGEVKVVNVPDADVGKYMNPFANQKGGGEVGVAGRFYVVGNMLTLDLGVAFAAVLL